MFLFFSEEHRRWRFASTLGGVLQSLGDDQWCTESTELFAMSTAGASHVLHRRKDVECGTAAAAQQNPSSVTLMDDNDAIRGEYVLLPDPIDGHACYRKSDSSAFLYFDVRRQCWRFSAVLGDADSSQDIDIGLTMTTIAQPVPVGNQMYIPSISSKRHVDLLGEHIPPASGSKVVVNRKDHHCPAEKYAIGARLGHRHTCVSQ